MNFQGEQSNLVPGETYFLKWSSNRNDNPERPQYMVIFEGEYIKCYDDTFREDYDNYNRIVDRFFEENQPRIPDAQFLEEIQPTSSKLIENNILINQVIQEGDGYFKRKEYPFEDQRFPYYSEGYSNFIDYNKTGNVCLFKFLRTVKIVFNGKDVTAEFKDPIKYSIDIFPVSSFVKEFSRNNISIYEEMRKTISFLPSMITNTGYKFIPNETLVWVDLNTFNVIESGIEQKIIHEKALTELAKKTNPDVMSEVAKFVGSKKYLEGFKKGGRRSKRRKNKSKKKYRKTKKSRRLYKK